MAAVDFDSMIELLQDAIRVRLEGGAVAEHVIRGRNIRYESLDSLRQILQWALNQKARQRGGGPFVYAVPGRAGGPP